MVLNNEADHILKPAWLAAISCKKEQKKQTKQANEPLNIFLNKTNNHYASTHRNKRDARTILLKIDVIFAQTRAI